MYIYIERERERRDGKMENLTPHLLKKRRENKIIFFIYKQVFSFKKIKNKILKKLIDK